MSSTNRSLSRDIHGSDYYVTPIDQIEIFLNQLLKYEPEILEGKILDPCAGGDQVNEMSYPTALCNFGVDIKNIDTIDIRSNSRSRLKQNYLTYNALEKPKLIITNPPFNIAMNIIEKSLKDVSENGFVIMLLRLNFFGGKSRKKFWDKNMPKYTFVHHKRMSFTEDKKTDSIEYAHFVWQKGLNPDFSMIKVI